MADMLNVYDLSLKKTAVLQNAFQIVETRTLNQIYALRFSLPADDPKAEYCLPRHYVRYGEKGELYRIIKPTYSEDNINVVTFDCEHVITTLCDNVLFGSYTYGGGSLKTADVINWVLSKQKTRHWKLGVCDFDRRFEYGWEQENLLNALYSIPKEFASPYQWTFDTTSHPWTINLKVIDTTSKPQYYLRAKKNILTAGSSEDYSEVCTRIYPLGYGEGVNQLGITEATVNAQGDADDNGTRYGKPYIDSPQSIIDQYGIIEKVLVDRRFEQANTLYAYAKSMLEVYQTPAVSRSFDVTDLYQITHDDIDQAEVGYICKLTGDGTITYITKTQRQWDLAGDLHIDIATKPTDVASSIADLADRVRIESVYAQGATQLYQHSKDANAAPVKGKGMMLSLYFPSEMRQINKVLLKLELKKFRYYSSTTEMSAQTTQSTEGGSASGSTSQSTGGGGGGITATPSVTVTVGNTGNANWVSTGGSGFFYTVGDGASGYTDTKGSHSHSIYGSTLNTTPYSGNNYRHYHAFDTGSSGAYSNGDHYHNVTVNSHSHRIYTQEIQHNHPVSVTASLQVSNTQSGYSGFAHSHTFNIGAHTHSVIIPAHKHEISPNIYESSATPTQFDIYVGSEKVTTVNATNYNGDITAWILDDKNQIPRDQWISVEIVPNALAYVVSSVFVQGFVQSRGGGNY